MDASTPSSPSEERLLLARVAGGDAEAVDRWYRAEHPQVHRLCLGFLADPVEADDLAQDAMLHLLDRLPHWDPERRFGTWRNTVVLNLCRDRLRSRQRRRKAERRAMEHHLQLLERRPLPKPDDEAERSEAQTVLLGALEQLTEREREAFVLRDLEGVETAEVARVMAVSASSVRSLLTLARRRLRGLLAPRLSAGGREHA